MSAAKLLKIEDIAERLDVGYTFAYELALRLPHIRLGTGKRPMLRVTEEAFDRFLRKGGDDCRDSTSEDAPIGAGDTTSTASAGGSRPTKSSAGRRSSQLVKSSSGSRLTPRLGHGRSSQSKRR